MEGNLPLLVAVVVVCHVMCTDTTTTTEDITYATMLSADSPSSSTFSAPYSSSSPTSAISSTTPQDCTDFKIEDLKIASDQKPFVIHLEWNVSAPVSCMDQYHYQVQWKEVSEPYQEMKKSVNSTEIYVETIPVCALFNISVSAALKDDVIESNAITGWSKSNGISSTVENLTIVRNESYHEEVELYWLPPNCDNAFVLGYKIDAVPDGENDNNMTCYVNQTETCGKEGCHYTFCNQMNKCLDYLFSVAVAYNGSGSYKTAHSISLNKTEDEEPIMNLTVTVLSPTKIQLQFELGTCVYERTSHILVTVGSQTHNENLSGCQNNICNFTYGELFPCEVYNITVQIEYKSGNGSKQFTIEPVTMPLAIPGIENIQVYERTFRKLFINWTISNKNTFCVSGYHVECKPINNDPQWKNNIIKRHTNSTSISINVHPCVDYIIRIKAYYNTSSKFSGSFTNANHSTSLDPAVPVVSDVEANATGPFNATLTWSIGQCGQKIKTLQVESENGSCEINFTKACHISSDYTGNCSAEFCESLTPCTSYDFTVYITVRDVHSMFNNKSQEITTLPMAPSAPTNLTINATAVHTLKVEWESPENYPQCVQYYNISYWIVGGFQNDYRGDSCRNESEQNTITLYNLRGCQEYEVEVWAVTSDNQGGDHVNTTSIVLATEQEHEVTDLQVTNINSTSATLKCTAPECKLIYTYQVWAYEVWQESSVKSKQYWPEEDCRFTLHELQPCTAYNFTVVTQYNSSDYNVTVGDVTKEEVPSEPQNLKTVIKTNSSISVEWSEPVTAATCVQTYNIYWKPQGDPNVTVQKNVSHWPGESTQNFSIYSLKPCTSYEITVIGVTQIGTLGKNATVKNDTAEEAPSEPQNLKTIIKTNSSISVEWSEPVTAATCVQTYNIYWKPQGDPNVTVQKNVSHCPGESTQNFSIYSLKPCTSYEITVIGVTQIGTLGKNATVKNDTAEEAPSAPEDLKLSEVRSNSAVIKWKSPNQGHECVDRYHIIVRLDQNVTDKWYAPKMNMSWPINNLKACGDYNVTVTGVTKHNLTGIENSTFLETEKLAPPQVNATVVSTSANALGISWIQPDVTNTSLCGEPTLVVNCSSLSPEDSSEEHLVDLPCNTSECWVHPLMPYTDYSCSVATNNSGGMSDETWFTARTSQAAPSQVVDLKVNGANYSEIILEWKSPHHSNGIITKYKITYTGSRKYYRNHYNSSTFECQNQSCSGYAMQNLLPEYSYKIQVSAYTVEYGPSSTVDVTTLAGIPPRPSEQNTSLSPQPIESNPEHQVKVNFPKDLFSDENGTILWYSLVVAQSKHAEHPKGSFFPLGNPPKLRTWANSSGGNVDASVRPYQATPLYWTRPSKGYFVIGENSSCEKEMETTYCNGPLKPGTRYAVKIRAYTNNSYQDTPLIHFYTAETSSSMGTIIGVVCTIFLIGIIVSSIFIYHRRHPISFISKLRLRKPPPSSRASATGSGTIRSRGRRRNSRSVRLSQLVSCYDGLLDKNKMLLVAEFAELGAAAAEFAHTTEEAKRNENRYKNRYINILPFDHSRVVLQPEPDDPFSDYINASYIGGQSRDKEYIATQGPKAETCDDFWQMIWEQKVKLIVMLAQCVEDGKPKCQQYWPEEGEVTEFGKITVKSKTVVAFSEYTKRIFLIRQSETEPVRSITQLHFVRWGDHDRPNETKALLDFVRVARENREPFAPTVVHCSAGVGRTGTFIALDILLYQALLNQQVDVFGTVLALRDKRSHMVQNQTQYAYIYECLRDATLDPNFFYGIPSEEPIYENIHMDTFMDDEVLYENVDLGKQSLRNWREEEYEF